MWILHQAALRSKNEEWLARNWNNVSKWSDMSTHEQLFQWASTIQIQTQHVDLVYHHQIKDVQNFISQNQLNGTNREIHVQHIFTLKSWRYIAVFYWPHGTRYNWCPLRYWWHDTTGCSLRYWRHGYFFSTKNC